MKNYTKIILCLALLFVSSCKKEEDLEPFSDKFKVTLTFKNWFDNPGVVTEYSGSEITVASGTTVYVNTSFGGEEGAGELVVQKIEVTRTTDGGSKTCVFTDKSNTNYGGLSEPVFENTTYSFTITTTTGETATQGPFLVKVANDEKILTLQEGLSAYGNNYKRFFSTSHASNAGLNFYDLNGSVDVLSKNVNLRHIDFAVTKDVNNNLFLTSPTQFTTLGMLPEFNDFSCSYRKTIFQNYSGSIDFSGINSILDENTLNFQDLSNLVFTSTEETIPVIEGQHFLFQTAEGKKGIGMFKNVVAGVSTEFIMVFQR